MLDITVKNVWKARDSFGDYDKIITVMSKEEVDDFLPKAPVGSHHHIEDFWDMTSPDGIHKMPSLQNVKDILKFSSNFKQIDKVLVHCQAGISRSTATAIGVLIQHGSSIEDAYRTIRTQRPKMSPNGLLILFFDQELGLNGSLIQYNKDFISGNILFSNV